MRTLLLRTPTAATALTSAVLLVAGAPTAGVTAYANPAARAQGPSAALSTPFHRVSLASDGSQVTVAASYGGGLVSENGLRVAFSAQFDNPLVGDTGTSDVYLRTRKRPFTSIISLATDGGLAGQSWLGGDLSADGGIVAFTSESTRLLRTPDTNKATDVFVNDTRARPSAVVQRVSVGPDGRQANGESSDPVLSADGRWIAYWSTAINLTRHRDTNGSGDVFLRNNATGRTRLVSVSSAGRQGNEGSSSPAISADGRYVAFSSGASNLVPHDTNGRSDVFVRDVVAGTTRRVSLSVKNGQFRRSALAPRISADGSVVSFDVSSSTERSFSSTSYVRDLEAHRTEVVSVDEDGMAHRGHDTGPVALSETGRFVLFSTYSPLTKDDVDPPLVDWNGDDVPDGDADVFLRDRETGRIVLVSRLPGSDMPVQAKSMDMNSSARQVVLWTSAPLSKADTNNQNDVWIRNVTEFTAG